MPRVLPTCLLAAALAFLALGLWQWQRLGQKRALIAQVAAMQAAAPAALPSQGAWPQLGKADAYRKHWVRGVFAQTQSHCVQAVTARGPGWWVLTPLRTTEGYWLWVNRGFAGRDDCAAARAPIAALQAPQAFAALLRLSEPKGAFLRANAPNEGRWYSRDVAALSQHAGLTGPVAPYFVDAATTLPGGPVGGMTVLRFANHHLQYALTWWTLAAMSLWGWWRVRREAAK